MAPVRLMGILLLGALARAGDARLESVVVPVHEAAAWQVLEFRRIKPNAVAFSTAGAHISVASSASPLIFSLPKPIEVSRVRARIKVSGSLKGAPASGGWDEDSQFRLGLVVSGEKRLKGSSKVLAPAWVRKLFSLAPEGGGVSRIVFLMLGRPPGWETAASIRARSSWKSASPGCPTASRGAASSRPRSSPWARSSRSG